MKKRSTRITPVTSQIPRMASGTAKGIETLQLMKTKFITLKLLVIFGSLFATMAVFGQTTRTWTGGNGTGLDLGAATNWGGTLPSTALPGDTGEWSGGVAGNLFLTYNGNLASGFGQSGVSFSLTAAQTGSVSISSPVSSSVNLAVLAIANNSANASFSLGDATANVLNVIWRPGDANTLHDFVNNSAGANIIYPNVRIQSGGGVVHVLLFEGTGNWNVTNNLICANGPGTLIQKTGSGTLFWNGPSRSSALGNGTINSPITIAGGTVVLMNNTVLSPLGSGNIGSQNIANGGTLFKYAAPSLTQILTGVISGGGNLEVAAGTLTLSGGSTYSGNTILSGGTLVVNGAENPGIFGPLGVGGIISFTGGTLGFSANNTFDYSSRFDTSASQLYSFDSGGQSVLLTGALGSSGGTLTKAGSGTLTLAGSSSYSGLTTVSAGKLVFQGSKTGSGNITVANSTALGVTATGTQVTPGTLTVGTSAGATLEFNGINSTVTAPLAAGTLATGGTVTVNVNSGTFAIGQSYPLLHWTGGSAPTVSLGTLTGAGGNLSISGNTLFLNITSLAYVWSGVNSGNWDTTTANNWTLLGSPATFANGGTALFDDTAAGQTNVILNAAVSQASITVNSSSKTYSIASSGASLIGGSGGLTKNGGSILTLSGGVNTYSGATTISGGTVSVSALANGSAPSDIGSASSSAANLVVNGGTLQYTNGGAASIDRLFTLGTGNGAIDASGSGALNLSNPGLVGLSGSGARTLTLTGGSTDANTLAAVLGDNGGATSLTKSGAGTWVLTGNNTNSGLTTIAAGELQIGTGGASGSLGSGNVTVNGSLDFNRSGTLTNGTISGTGSVTNDGSGTVILPGDNSYSGGTTINAGTLQVGNGGATGKLSGTGPVMNNGTFIFNSTGSATLTGNGLISGTGNVIVRGGGLLQAIGGNTYTGWTLIESGSTFQPCQGNQGALVSSVVTNNGTLKLVRQDNGIFIYSGPIVGTGSVVVDANNVNVGDVTFTGTNTYTGGTIICNNTLVLGDGSTPGAGTIVGNVFFTNSPTPNENPRQLTFNHPEDLTFAGNISYSTNLAFGNRGIVAQLGAGVLTLTGTNDYPGGTLISNVTSVIQVGNGGTSGSIGTGPVTDNGVLVFNRSDDITFGGVINGSGSVVKLGAGALALTGTNNIFGTLTVSNGTLFVNNENFAASTTVTTGTLGGTGAFYGPVTLNAGTTFAPGASANAIGTFMAVSDLTIGGNVVVQVNKSLAQSNDLAVVSGTLSKTGTGTLTVTNVGPALAVGDKFTLFSQPLTGGTLTVTGAGATWKNDLAVDGSITALTVSAPVNPNPPVMQVSVSGGALNLAWPTNLGWTLQTNGAGLAAASQWFPYPGSASVTNVSIIISPAKTNVFFRMVLP